MGDPAPVRPGEGGVRGRRVRRVRRRQGRPVASEAVRRPDGRPRGWTRRICTTSITCPPRSLAAVNLMSLFGLHRELRGAAVGHFAATEITSSPGSRRLVDALDAGCTRRNRASAFYREHVEADAVHEQVVRYRRRRRPGRAGTAAGGRRGVRHQGLRRRREPIRRPLSWPVGRQADRHCAESSPEVSTAAPAPPVAGVAQRVGLASPAGADRDHEPVGFDDGAVGAPRRGPGPRPSSGRRARSARRAGLDTSWHVRSNDHQFLLAPARFQ